MNIFITKSLWLNATRDKMNHCSINLEVGRNYGHYFAREKMFSFNIQPSLNWTGFYWTLGNGFAYFFGVSRYPSWNANAIKLGVYVAFLLKRIFIGYERNDEYLGSE